MNMRFNMTETGFYTETEYGDLHISSNVESGYRPFQLFVSSVATCSGGLFRTILDKKRIDFEHIYIDVKTKRKEIGAREITDIHLHFILVGANVEEHTLEKILKLAKKHCPIVQSVNNSIRVTETFEMK
ncbi:OsmC family protein [Halalkalibacter urbisdiaboli]|uniref:OsmC family protein n=1 Tax=Halalkalibacter urbisdiaboli TaxID=1960589 RepID=UPI001FD989C2|nr:OsmC family protein [Halalkalibacter urbisdiaboli]